MGDTGTAVKKPTRFITSHSQLDEHHNAIHYIENDTESIVNINLLFTNSKEPSQRIEIVMLTLISISISIGIIFQLA